MLQEPYETNSDANDMAPSVEPNIELANEILAKSLPLIEQVAENPTVKEILEAQNLELLQVSVSPAEITQDEVLDSEKLLSKETLEVVRTPISQVEIDAVHQEILAAIEEQNAQPVAPVDAVSTKTQGQPHHIQVGTIHFKNPA